MKRLDKLYHHAVSLLARKDYTNGEMRRILSQLTEDSIDVEVTLSNLRDEGYINDQRIAENMLSRFLRKQYGVTRIRLELRQKGIAREITENLINSLDIDWFELASESRIKKFGEELPSEPKEKARQIRYLQNRGFAMDAIMEALSPQEN
ncbi:regulatory protein RecX [Providencia rettgeri]